MNTKKEEKNNKGNSTFVKVLKIIGNVILWIFVAFAALLTVVAITSTRNDYGMANVLGYSPVTVLTDSMKDTFNAGDLLLVKVSMNSDSNDIRNNLKVNDIVVYSTYLKMADGSTTERPVLNTHRIVSVETDSTGRTFYRTQGDNKVTNPVPDENPVYPESVLGIWESKDNGISGGRLPGVGGAINWLRTPTGFLICIVIPLLVFFLYELYRFIAIIVANRSKKTVAVDEEEIKRKAIEEYLAAQKKAAEEAAAAKEAPSVNEEPSADEAPTLSEAQPDGAAEGPDAE